MLNSITVIIKTSNLCNIKCSYCYVNQCKKEDKINPVNPSKLIENCVKGFSQVNFVWLGGEPLLMGLDYYKEINDLQNIYREKGIKIHNSLQTNGILLNDDFLSFFKKNHFGIGISFDAPYSTQIKTRTAIFSEQQWLDLFKKVKDFGLNLSFLSVVTEHNVDKPKEIINFFEKVGADHFSLHPVITFGENEKQDDDSLFLLFKTIFDIWLTQKNSSIKHIDPLSSMMTNLYGRTTLCIFSSKCAKGLISISPAGAITPCSSLDVPEFEFGNITQNPLIEILQNNKTKSFRKNLVDSIKRHCKSCKYISICRNGCKSFSYWSKTDKYPLCETYKKTYDYLLTKMSEYQ